MPRRPASASLSVAFVGCACFLAACASAGSAASGNAGQGADAGFHFDIVHQDSKPSDVAPIADTAQPDVAGSPDTPAVDAPAPPDLQAAPDVAPQDTAAPICGDGLCSGDETTQSCYADCPVTAMCGDNLCNGTENTTNCLKDCPAGPPVCGDGVCQNPEGPMSCGIDCDPLVIGIIACLQEKCSAETTACLSSQVCYGVLGTAAQCLSNSGGSADQMDWCKTSVSKTPLAVPVVDCGFDACVSAPAGKICGDGKCDANETKAKCPIDCHDAPKCGDGACTAPESMANCPADCKPA